MGETCRHWIGSDTTGHVCGQEAVLLSLCAKHYEIERQRLTRYLEKRRASQARTEAAWRARNVSKLPQWRVTLERAEAELTRRTASTTDDTAAFGGNMNASIARARTVSLSDSNITRVAELQRIIKNLTAAIARAEAE